jgi:hypothetical protein
LPSESSNQYSIHGCPYLSKSGVLRLDTLIKRHLECSRVPGSQAANPYQDRREGFHVTFFEIIKNTEELKNQSQWKIGRMFYNVLENRSSGEDKYIRRSAFSVRTNLGPGSIMTANPLYIHFQPTFYAPFYTGVLLIPEGFSPSSEDNGIEHRLRKLLLPGTSFEAEINCIVYGIADIIDRWTALDEYLEKLLEEDFMNPRQYAKLLFDDESFSRSQKYFWAIGCLTEFDASITDNIKQIDLYSEARIKPQLLRPNLGELLDAMSIIGSAKLSAENGAKRVVELKKLVKKFEDHRESLMNLQGQFRSRLETVKALREGVSYFFQSKLVAMVSILRRHSNLMANL